MENENVELKTNMQRSNLKSNFVSHYNMLMKTRNFKLKSSYTTFGPAARVCVCGGRGKCNTVSATTFLAPIWNTSNTRRQCAVIFIPIESLRNAWPTLICLSREFQSNFFKDSARDQKKKLTADAITLSIKTELSNTLLSSANVSVF